MGVPKDGMTKPASRNSSHPVCRPPDAPLAGKRILVIEDEPIIALELQDSLYAAGAEEVELCFCVSERTLSMLPKSTMAVLDLDIQGKSSAPIALELHELGIPFIFITGHSDEAFDATLKDFPRFNKPIDMQKLIGFLSQLGTPD